jgi:hypothetical protein
MSIWINKSILIIALAGLTACQGFEVASPNRTVSVLNGAVKIAPPNGYCVDPKSSKGTDDSGVVVMGRCSAGSVQAPALLTASIGAAGSDAALAQGHVALTSFFGSPQGLAMLASSGVATDAELTASQSDGDVLFLQINDKITGSYWRAIAGLNGRLLMLTATGAEDLILSPVDGRNLLAKTLAALKRANAV